MDQLSSCYFCGAALDASLTEHPVVPAALDPSGDVGTTVVLCATCGRKFEAIRESVVAAVDGESERPAETASESGTDASRDEAADEAGGPTTDPDAAADIESTLGDDEDVLQPVGDRDDDEGWAHRPSEVEASEMEWGGPREANSDDEDPDEAGGGEDGDDQTDHAEAAAGGHDDGTGTGENTASDRSGSSSTHGNGPRRSEDDDGGEGEGSDGGERDVTLTRLENTKVMRLLQNREFPVDRDDFVTVASSAYEVSRRDCDKVIELAVEHDLLRDDDGELYAGSRWS